MGRNPRDEHVGVPECTAHFLGGGLDKLLNRGFTVAKKHIPILWFPLEGNEWTLNVLPEALCSKKYVPFGDAERQSAWPRDLEEDLANADALRSLQKYLEENKDEYNEGGLPLETLPAGGAAPPAFEKGQEEQAARGRGAASTGDVEVAGAPPAAASGLCPTRRRGRGEGQNVEWWKGDGMGGGARASGRGAP